MRELTVEQVVRGPWSLSTSRDFWEGFAPAALPGEQRVSVEQRRADRLATVFRVEADWSVASVEVVQTGKTAEITVQGTGDLEAAVAQTVRFLSLDVDATEWPDVGERDAVIADAQRELPGFRPCGFHSPYEAAAWAVLSQRIRIEQAAKLRAHLVQQHGEQGAFPAPAALARLDLDLPGRKSEYLQAVAEAALAGQLDGAAIRRQDPDEAVSRVQEIKGIGPFAAELIVLRGANAPDAMPRHEKRLETEIFEKYGRSADLAEISERWRPFRTWAAVHLRALREQRTHEIGGRRQVDRTP